MRFTKVIILSFIALLLFSCTSEAQKKKSSPPAVNLPVDKDVSYTHVTIDTADTRDSLNEENDALFKLILQKGEAQHIPSLEIGKRVVGYGKLLLGNPYADKTLEVNPNSESLVCNLTGFDCVTFFENAWAFARTVKADPAPTDKDFTIQLRTLRYRDGVLDGYASRLHYTTDYFYNNAKRGNLEEMTYSIAGVYAIIEDKPIDFMSNHPASYKQIENNQAEWKRIEFYEREMANRGGFYYIKKENVAKIEKGIQDGDLIGITTSIPGIDCSHTGIAVRGDDGRIHLMHASLTKKKVIISDEPLADYLAGNSKQTGIIVYRPLEVKSK